MTWNQIFSTSVGKKITMSLTGIFLILFLVVHAGLNACIWAFDEGETFNKAAAFMGNNWVPRVLEIGLFGGLLLHIFQGYSLELANRSKRAVNYAIPYGNKGSKWYSRSMAILGTLLLMFLIMHIYQFWTPSRLGGMMGIEKLPEATYNGKEIHNLFYEMKEEFENPIIVVFYVLACASLGYHLAHGFQSAFRTLGVHNKRYSILLSSLGYGFSIFVPLIFALMPISFLFKLV